MPPTTTTTATVDLDRSCHTTVCHRPRYRVTPGYRNHAGEVVALDGALARNVCDTCLGRAVADLTLRLPSATRPPAVIVEPLSGGPLPLPGVW